MNMSLSTWTLILGALLLAPGLLACLAPAFAARAAHAFPRHVWVGRWLAAAAWTWSGWALYVMPLELLEPVRQYIPWLALAAIPLSWIWMSDLLACRALGGLRTLFPCPLLHVARVHPSAWRLVVVSLAYVAIVAGMDLILYPYHLRRALHGLAAGPARLRAAGLAAILLGGLLVGLALTVLQV